MSARRVAAAVLSALFLVAPTCLVARATEPPGTTFVVTCTTDDGPGSLRRALEDANRTPNPPGGRDRIVFDIPGDGPHVIALASALPVITEAVLVDGLSQPGALAADLAARRDALVTVQLDGSVLADGAGLVLRCDDALVRGLAVVGFAGDALRIENGARNVVTGNRLGVPIAPSARAGNGGSGVFVTGDAAVANTVVANAILGNARTGITLERTSSAAADARQPSPRLAKVTRVPGAAGEPDGATVEGTLSGTPGALLLVDLYASPALAPASPSARVPHADDGAEDADPVRRQGERWIGRGAIALDASGSASFTVRLPQALASRALVTAIATDARGNSSEFSPPVRAPQATKSWNNPAGGNWSVAGNWTPSGAPGSTDDARIDLDGTYTVTLDAAATVNSLVIGSATSGTQTLSLTGQNITLAAASSVGTRGAIVQSGGSLAGAGSLTVDGAFTWNGGSWAGGGTTTLNNGLTVGGSSLKDVNPRVVVVSGNVVQGGTAGIRLFAGSSFTSNGTYDIQADVGVALQSGTPSFTNNGTLKKSAGTGTSTVSVTCNNVGTVSVQTGTLNFSGGGTSTGPFNGAAGTTLQFGGTHDLSGNIGASTFSVSGGTVNVNGGTFSATASTFSSGTTTFAAAATVSAVGALTISGGTVNYNSGETIAAPSIALSTGTLGGSDTVNASTQITWSGGTIGGSGILNANAGMALSGSALKEFNTTRTLNLSGTTTMAGTGGVRMWGGTINVNPGATFDIQADIGIALQTGSPVVNNNGTFRKSAGTGTSTVSVPFNDSGAVDLQSGTLAFSGSGTHVGTFTGAAGTTLQFSGGTHNLSGNVNVAAISVGATAVNVNGGTFSATASTFSSGTTTFAAGATVSSVGALTVSGGTVNFNSGETIASSSITLSAGTLGGSDTINASTSVAWSGGTIGGSGVFNANAGIATSGASLKEFNTTRTLNLSGTSTMTGTGGLRLWGGTINVNPGATFDIQADIGIALQTGSPLVSNNGTFRKSAGGGTSSVGVPFNNAATVDLQSGTLVFSANGTHAGAFSGAAGTTLQFGGGTHDLSGNVSVAAFSVAGATVNVNAGTFSATASTFSSGTATFAAAATVSSVGALTVSGGTVNFNSGETIAPSSITLSGGTLGGSDTIDASTSVAWSGGAIGGSGVFNANAGMAMSGTALKDFNTTRTLNLSGTSTMTGTAGVRMWGGTININPGATVDIQADVGFALQSGTPSVVNNGTLTKSAGTGASSNNVPFGNAGTVSVQAGTLNLAASGTHTGSFSGAAGTTLQFGGGTHDLSGNVSVATFSVSTATVNVNGGTFSASTSTFPSGTTTFAPAATLSAIGALTVSAGTVVFNSGETVTPPSLTLSAGTLSGSDTVNVPGAFTWTGGTLAGTGVLNASGGAALSGGNLKDVNSRSVVFGGTSTMSGLGGLRFFGGSLTIAGGAVLDVQADIGFTMISGTPSITNNGTLRKSAGSGTTTVGPTFTNAGAVEALAGTFQFLANPGSFTQTAGTTTLNGGAITSTTTMAVQGGTLTGAGTVTGAVTSGGAVAPGNGIGVLNVTGNYVQQAAGAFNPQIGGLAAGTQYDQLKVLGASTATLAGTLNVSLANGFVPTDGNAFSVMTFASATGTFGTLNFPVLPQGCWLIAYRATDVQLSVTTRTPDVATVRFTNKTTLSWTGLDARFGSASYDVMRGATSQMPVGGKPGETCLAQSIAGTSFTDANQPAVGQSTYYLVRGKTPCGPGTWGTTSAGAERTPTVCP